MAEGQLTVPVPRALADWVLRVKRRPTLNDMVEHFHMQLVGSGADSYLKLFDAVYNEQAVEGSLISDDHEAARMIRDAAINEGSPLAREKLATVVKALRVVLRRYNMSRNERRGYFVDHDGGRNDNNHDSEGTQRSAPRATASDEIEQGLT